MLVLEKINVSYGPVKVLHDLSLTVNEGEIVALIGANGAGKTTTLRSIMGVLRASSGSIVFKGQKIYGRRPVDIIRAGISMVPEGRRVFGSMSIEDNLEVGGAPSGMKRAQIKETMERVFCMYPILRERRNQMAGTLSGGEQQMLAIGRALMAHPKLLLLDEPSMGLAPVMVERTFESLKELNKSGTTMLLVEQNAQMALEISDRGYALQNGRVVYSGKASDLLGDESIREAYFGIKKEAVN
ncbi:MAG: ABC transporter ATP-binding protein [Bacillota bacterium]|nr:ABC transporter ATP-binding protein [Bacillota bacterium]